MKEFENLPVVGDSEELLDNNTKLRNEAWSSFSNDEKFYFARLYFELLDVDQRNEVWNFCNPEDRFNILSQQHYYSAVEDQSRDESLGFIKGEESHKFSVYFNLLTSDDQKNEAWALLPEPTANDWDQHWLPETPDDVIDLNAERLLYFHSISLEDRRMRIGSHDADEGELWKTLNTENRCKYFNFFPSFCNSNQRSEVWQYLNSEEKALLVAKTSFHWTAFMLFDSIHSPHNDVKDEAWSLLDDASKVYIMCRCLHQINDVQKNEAWALADRDDKVIVFNEHFNKLTNDQKRETWDLMTRKEKKYASNIYGLKSKWYQGL